MVINVLGSPTGGGRRTNRLTIEKMVELAAMPRPMEATTASTKPGNLESRRNAYVRSCRQAAMGFFSAVCYYVATGPIVPWVQLIWVRNPSIRFFASRADFSPASGRGEKRSAPPTYEEYGIH